MPSSLLWQAILGFALSLFAAKQFWRCIGAKKLHMNFKRSSTTARLSQIIRSRHFRASAGPAPIRCKVALKFDVCMYDRKPVMKMRLVLEGNRFWRSPRLSARVPHHLLKQESVRAFTSPVETIAMPCKTSSCARSGFPNSASRIAEFSSQSLLSSARRAEVMA